jgi:hypothetical protein
MKMFSLMDILPSPYNLNSLPCHLPDLSAYQEVGMSTEDMEHRTFAKDWISSRGCVILPQGD